MKHVDKNLHETVARRRKVDALADAVVHVLRPRNRFEAGALAALLLGTSQASRDAFALAAGQRSPSAETWRQVVAAVRRAA